MAEDRKLFREMSEPHPTRQRLNEDLEKFFAGVEKLRKTCKLTNVLIVVESSYLSEDSEAAGFALQTIGDRFFAQTLAAHAYGTLRGEFTEQLGRMLSPKN